MQHRFSVENQAEPVGSSIQMADDPDAPARALLALEAGNMASWRYDVPAGLVTGDHLCAEFFNVPYDAQPWPLETVFDVLHPDDRQSVMDAVDGALDHQNFYDAEFRVVSPDPVSGSTSHRWLGARGNVTERAADGRPLVMIGVNWDMTQQKQLDERLAMMATEMDHRVKNAFAVMCAMINLGERVARDKVSLSRTLLAQVRAMADTHALTTELRRVDAHAADDVAINDILKTALAPWLSPDGGITTATPGTATVHIDTDPDIRLKPLSASAFAMMVYELTTNAAKYGGLSTTEGRLTVTARRGRDKALTLHWSEKSSGTATTDPSVISGGFGATLIDFCVNSMHGQIVRDLTPDGMQITLTIPTA